MMNLAEGFASRGYESEIVVCQGGGELTSWVPASVTLTALDSGRALSSLVPLALHLRRTRPSAMVSAKTHFNVAAILARCLSGVRIKHLVSERSHYQMSTPQGLRNRIALRLAGRLYGCSKGVVAVSEDVANAVKELVPGRAPRVSVVENPVVTPSFYRRIDAPFDPPTWFEDPRRTVIGVGRLVPEKGFETLIKAMSIVREEHQLRLVILGEGPERLRLRAAAESVGLGHSLELPGFVDDPLPFMSRARAFVLSSNFEGFPGVLVEALFSGCPVVATDCSSGVRKILDDGAYGKLVPVGDADAMAAAITSVLEEESDPDRLRTRAEEFNVDSAVSAYESLIFSEAT